ncbi:type 1 fimbrial protein [Morganella morganii]|nr:type 1 fimbrial protein [Morganella morganii]
MKKLQFFIAAAGLLMSSFAPATESKGRSVSGVIIFHGAIVEGPCTMAFQTNDISSSCYRSGMKKERLTTRTITRNTRSVSDLIPASMGEAKLHWLDDSKRLAMVVVSYL